MKNKLPFNFDPPLRAYQDHAYVFGILNDSCKPWLYSTYFQITSIVTDMKDLLEKEYKILKNICLSGDL